MKEFIYKGKTTPDNFRFKKDELQINGMAIKFEPKKGITFFEVNYKSELDNEEAEKKIEAILDAWAKEMSFKYNQNIKYTQLSFGPVDGIKKGCITLQCRLVTVKDSIDPTPKYTEIINSYEHINYALFLYRESLPLNDPFFYHYMICEAIEKLCTDEGIVLSEINYNKNTKELLNRHRHYKHKLPAPSKKCEELLNLPKNKQLKEAKNHSKEIIENCILYLQKFK